MARVPVHADGTDFVDVGTAPIWFERAYPVEFFEESVIVVVREHLPDKPPMHEISPADSRLRLFFDHAQSRHHDRHQQSNDRDNNQQLDQGGVLLYFSCHSGG